MALTELKELLLDLNKDEKNIIYQCGEPVCSSLVNKKSCRITLVDMLTTDEQMNAFVRVDITVFKNLVKVYYEYQNNKVSEVDSRVRVMLCLCKLRLNFNFLCLSVLFNLKKNTCCNYFYADVQTLAEVLKEAVYWPSKEEILSNRPICFDDFRDTVAVLDCTEVPIQVPSYLTCRIRLNSHYKGTHTIKILLAVSPFGQIIGIGAVFGGRSFDKAIFNHSKMIENFTSGIDAVMTDKGFDIEKECLDNNIKLWRPPKLAAKKQFTYSDFVLTKKIASARVHVERSIQRVKISKMFQSRIQWNLMPHLDDIFTVICGLVNLNPPILSEEKFL